MKKYLFLFFILYSSFTFTQTTPTITTAQEKTLKEIARQLIISFNNNLGMLGDATLKSDEKKVYSGDNLSKFESEKVKIFNDLDPTGATGKEFSVKIYQNNIITWFPNGVTLTYSNYNISDIYTDNTGNFLIVKVQFDRQLKGTNINSAVIDDKRMLDAYVKFPFTMQTNSYSNPKISKIGFQTDDLKDYKKINAGGTNTEQNVKEETKEQVKLSLTPAQEKTFISGAILLADQSLTIIKGLGDNNTYSTEEKQSYVKPKIMAAMESPNATIINNIDEAAQNSEISINNYTDDFINKYPNGLEFIYSKPMADVVYNNTTGKFMVVKVKFDLELKGTDVNGKNLASKKQMDMYVKYSDKGSQIYKIAYHTDNNPELEKILVTESADAKSNSNQKLINDLLNAKKESEDKLKKKIQELEAKSEEAKKARIDAELERKRKEEEAANLIDKKIKDKYSYSDKYKSGTILKWHLTRAAEGLAVFGIEQKIFERKEHFWTAEGSGGVYFTFPISLTDLRLNPIILDSVGGEHSAEEYVGGGPKHKFQSGYTYRFEIKKYYRLKTMNYLYFSFLWFSTKVNFSESGSYALHYGYDASVGSSIWKNEDLTFNCTRTLRGGFVCVGKQTPFGTSRISKDWYVGAGYRNFTLTTDYANTKANSKGTLYVILGIKLGFRLGK